jgi:hypothetical protein
MAYTNIVYISLGSDCAVRYQLGEHNLVSQTFPFDWAKTNNIDMICDTLEKDFSNFFEGYKTKPQSDNFVNFDNLEECIKSKIQLKLSNNIVMPHEAIGDVFDEYSYIEKYMRRVDRFRNIVRDKEIKKIFIRSDDKQLNENQISKLYHALDLYGCVNYNIKFICYLDYKFTEQFTWQRNYICWSKIFFDNITTD